MSQATIIIEMRNNNLEGLYSTSDITILFIDRDKAAPGRPASIDRFTPTLVKADLSKVFPDEPEIATQLQDESPAAPYF